LNEFQTGESILPAAQKAKSQNWAAETLPEVACFYWLALEPNDTRCPGNVRAGKDASGTSTLDKCV